MRYLGIDYGNKKVGLAISDEAGSFAFPYGVIKNDTLPKLVEEIKKICEKEKIKKLVIGESLDLSGQANPIQKDILIFKDRVGKEIGLPVVFQTEFFTTQEARRGIDDPSTTLRARSGQNDPMTDARAAALILKSFLEKIANK
ncbi:MAG: Holliday junction resolvase RuvX [Candidatus Paceibacterota bacterium]